MEKYIETLKEELQKMNEDYIVINHIMQEVWTYHPSNPDFVNPISYFEFLKEQLDNINRRINEVEREINEIL